jgi:hypothetical protein
MGLGEKPRDGKKTRSADRAGVDAPPAQELASALVDGVKASAKAALHDKRPYLAYAFANPYNVSLFVGALAAAGLTLNPLLAIAAVGLEALWLLYAPDSKRLRHLLWDPRFEKARNLLLAQERAGRLQTLGEAEQQRFAELISRQCRIKELAASNPSFTGDLLRAELVKTDRLVDAFLDMAVTWARYESYLESVDLRALERERARWESESTASGSDEMHVDLARKNLAVILKRLDKLKEIRRYVQLARVQLDLIENTFRLIEDQIVTFESPQQLAGQLDELLDGVESIKQATVDAERLLGSAVSPGETR